jgi:hypothetical protein
MEYKLMKDYVNFEKWLNEVLQSEIPNEAVAINFNLYKGNDATYHIQLIASESFDAEDGDWACDEVFSTGEKLCFIPITPEIEDWEDGFEYLAGLAKEYLKLGKYAEKLKGFEAVGIGFVDGDIEILYP